jgi:hypothetical protein
MSWGAPRGLRAHLAEHLGNGDSQFIAHRKRFFFWGLGNTLMRITPVGCRQQR